MIRLARTRASCLAAMILAWTVPALAQTGILLEAEALRAGLVVTGEIRGDATAEYRLRGEAGQMLSVDLLASNPSAQFNISQVGDATALFAGATSGAVADIPLPATGEYAIAVYLMRNAARRDETTRYTLGVGLGGPEFADSLSGGPDFWAVTGVAPGSALNIRSGPATRYPVIGRADHGRLLQNRGCRMTGPERWCRIRAVGTGQQGWVAGRFLTEAAPPPAPEMPAGGPVGDGAAFDATGVLSCAADPGQPLGPCPFGVVRDGPGNAGIWIGLGDGVERQILFEGGLPVASNAPGAVAFEKEGDLYRLRVGAERYEVPEAVLTGG